MPVISVRYWFPGRSSSLHRPGDRRAPALIQLLIVVLACAGCAAVGPNYIKPQTPAPQAWNTALNDSVRAVPVEAASMARWWQRLDDPVLTGLIERALAGNLDRKEALARLRQARADRSIARAELFPGLSADGSVKKAHAAGETATSYGINLDASWEIDLFGGQRRSGEAAAASLEAAQEDLNDVLVSLSAEVALNYIEARTTQARLAAAQANLAIQEETYALEQARQAAGLSDALAVQQARANLEGTRAQIPTLMTSLEESCNRLAVLLGETPGALAPSLAKPQPIPTVPRETLIGIPADTVRNRPDVRKAERELAAQTAKVGVATAELYPKLTLTGSLGTLSASAGDLFTAGSRLYSYGPSISWPVFKAGALKAEVEVQSALQEQALYRYQSTVLTALEEAENAVCAYIKEQSRRDTLTAAVQAAREAQTLAQIKYEAGLADFNTVLTAQQTLTALEDSLAQSTGAVAEDLVRLYKALGGGWAASDANQKTS